MDFTREPIIETIITPREGYKLVVRSSKSLSQEEHFVDAVEVISFGNAFFYRSQERPKPFLVPISDYEVLEVREARMVLKTPHVEGQVKIGGGREAYSKPQREERREREREREQAPQEEEREEAAYAREGRQEGGRSDRRRERRRMRRKRGGGFREEGEPQEERMQREAPQMAQGQTEEILETLPPPQPSQQREMAREEAQSQEPYQPGTLFRAVLPPPSTLIRDDLQRLRENELYRGAFFIRDEKADEQDDDDATFESFSSPEEYFEQSKEENPMDPSQQKEASNEEEPFLFSRTMEESSSKDVP